MAMRSMCRMAVGNMLIRPLSRKFHMDSTQPIHRDISEIFSDMISSGPHPSTENINTFMNAVYLHKPRAVTLFSINYRSQSESSTIKGLRVGTNTRRGQPQKNIILVSGLPLQDPSVISVNLYVAAMLSRLNPMLTSDVSIIPLAHPKEYEQRWCRKSQELVPPSTFLSQSSSPPSSLPHNDPSKWITPENIPLELRDTCKPLEVYITRQNKYYINIDVDLTTHGSTIQYKSNSLPHLASRGKFRNFFTQQQKQQQLHQSPLILFPTTPSYPTITPIPAPQVHGSDPVLSPLLAAPSLVLELRSNQALDDEQVVARGEEVIAMVKELLV